MQRRRRAGGGIADRTERDPVCAVGAEPTGVVRADLLEAQVIGLVLELETCRRLDRVGRRARRDRGREEVALVEVRPGIEGLGAGRLDRDLGQRPEVVRTERAGDRHVRQIDEVDAARQRVRRDCDRQRVRRCREVQYVVRVDDVCGTHRGGERVEPSCVGGRRGDVRAGAVRVIRAQVLLCGVAGQTAGPRGAVVDLECSIRHRSTKAVSGQRVAGDRPVAIEHEGGRSRRRPVLPEHHAERARLSAASLRITLRHLGFDVVGRSVDVVDREGIRAARIGRRLLVPASPVRGVEIDVDVRNRIPALVDDYTADLPRHRVNEVLRDRRCLRQRPKEGRTRSEVARERGGRQAEVVAVVPELCWINPQRIDAGRIRHENAEVLQDEGAAGVVGGGVVRVGAVEAVVTAANELRVNGRRYRHRRCRVVGDPPGHKRCWERKRRGGVRAARPGEVLRLRLSVARELVAEVVAVAVRPEHRPVTGCVGRRRHVVAAVRPHLDRGVHNRLEERIARETGERGREWLIDELRAGKRNRAPGA